MKPPLPQPQAEPVPLNSLVIPVAHPRESIIPFAPWKLFSIGVTGLFLWGLMLWVGQLKSLQPAFEEILGLQHRRLPHFFSTVCLLAATQLSALILWYRIRSKKDFSGRYRIWFLATLFWGLTCFCVTTGSHVAWANWAYREWPINMWQGVTLYWMIPTAICFLALHQLLQLEMHLSQASRLVWDATWWLALVAGLTLLIPAVLMSPAWRLPVQIGAETLWHLSAAMALLVHARFVVHVTNEAAPKRPPRWKRIMHSAHTTVEKLAQSIPRPKYLDRATGVQPESTSKVAAKSKTTTAAPNRAAVATSTTAVPPKAVVPPVLEKPKPVPAPPAKPVPAPPVAPVAVKADPSQRTVSSSGAEIESPPAKSSVRLDPPQRAVPPPVAMISASHDDDETDDEDDGDDSNLSRKERRRLKKQKRANSR